MNTPTKPSIPDPLSDYHHTVQAVSAWLDGEGDFPLHLLTQQPSLSTGAPDLAAQALLSCSHHQVVGEVMRQSWRARGCTHGAFWLQLRQRVLIDPRAAVQPVLARTLATPAANDAWHRKAWATAASVGLVAVLGWQWWGHSQGDFGSWAGRAEQVVRNAPPATGVSPTPERAFDGLLLAHQRPGEASAFQSSAGFLRNVTHESVAR